MKWKGQKKKHEMSKKVHYTILRQVKKHETVIKFSDDSSSKISEVK